MSPRAAAATGSPTWTFETRVHFGSGRTGQRRLREGEAPEPVPVEPGRVPRVVRLLALAHRLRGLLDAGTVQDQANLARVAGVTRARVTQILNLLHLAPDIQEAVLDLPRTLRGRDPISEVALRPIAAVPEWGKQRALWRELVAVTDGRVVLDVSGGPRPHVPGRVAKGTTRERRSP